jgi:hypothetical protein
MAPMSALGQKRTLGELIKLIDRHRLAGGLAS